MMERQRDEEWRCINDEFYYSASQLYTIPAANRPGLLLQKKNEWEASTADYYAPFVVK